MPFINFRALNKEGHEVRGKREVKDRFELARALREEGLTLIAVEEGLAGKTKFFSSTTSFTEIFGRVSLNERIFFTKNLAVMASAGLSLPRALDALSHETHNEKFRKVLSSLSESIRRGETLSGALAKYPQYFSSLFVAMVDAGEKSGKLKEALLLLSSQMQSDADILRKVRGAMIYPAIILAAMVVIGALMIMFVVPVLADTFHDLNVELPVTTRFIIAMSDFSGMLGLYMFGGLIVLAVIIWRFLKTVPGKYFIDIVVLKAPVIGPLSRKFNAARTSRTLGSLLSSGVPIMDAIDITTNVLQNHYYKKVLAEAKLEIQHGRTIAEVFLKNQNLYPSLLGEMVQVGEETGQIAHMLDEVASFYEKQVSDTTKDMSTIIEPVLMIIIGAAVGFFAVSMITPMYSMLNSI